MRLSILFKNFVLLDIEQIRIKKAKPGLKELIMKSLKQKSKKDVKIREILKKQIIVSCQQSVAFIIPEGDLWYNRIVAHVDRLLKICEA